MKNERIVVTGSAGFIGSHTVARLLGQGACVLGIDNYDAFYARAIKERNEAANRAAAGGEPGRYTFIEVDIAEPDAFAIAVESFRPTGIIHLAAKAGVRPSIDDPPGYVRANVVAVSEVLEAAHRLGCSRVVVASSSSVYGDTSPVPLSEDGPAVDPISPYAATKRAAELLATTHHHLTGQPISCLRFFTVFGPRQRPDLAIAKFMRRIDDGEPITMFGNGDTSRDYTYIDDIVSGIVAAYERTPAFGFRVWNLGSDRPTRLDDLIALIGEVVGKAPVIEHADRQPGDVKQTWADLTRSTSELGYEPKTPLRVGLEQQWAAARENAG
ncbi:MAG: GDP-mannose 4,6-dehydratase [Phycisphaeraceae bacterium]|nr:MAG: GDP-mannose 4,6-dehydratase [Phycisphaeraceae bacterium]